MVESALGARGEALGSSPTGQSLSASFGRRKGAVPDPASRRDFRLWAWHKSCRIQFLPTLRATHAKRSFPKEKRFVSLSRDKAFGKTLCGTTLGCRPPYSPAAHCPPSRAGAVTGTKRPRLLASSFSRRLQGDFRPASPSASHHNSGSLCGNRRVTRPFPRQMFHFTGLSYHNFFVCQGGFRKKSHVPPPALEVRAASQYSFSVSWHHSGRDPKPVVIMR